MNLYTWTLSFSSSHPTPCPILCPSHLHPILPSPPLTCPSTSPRLSSVLLSLLLLSSPLPPPPVAVSMAVADSDFASKMKNRQMGTSGGVNMTKSTSISGDMCNLEKTDGSQSDTAVSTVGTDDKKRRSSIGAKMQAMVGMSRKSRSTSQLSQTGRELTSTNLPVRSYCFLFAYLCVLSVMNLIYSFLSSFVSSTFSIPGLWCD